MNPTHKMIGVLGGMGPAATADFMRQVILSTPARRDQDHVPLLIFSDPTIPDRSSSIIDSTVPSPLPMLRDYALRLQHAGATAIVIPCNTAHHFYDQIAGCVTIPILHIVDAVREELDENTDLRSCGVAIMATAGTLRSRFYERKLTQAGYGCIVPTETEQHLVDRTIQLIKGGQSEMAKPFAIQAVQSFRQRGAGSVILGCTELPLIKEVFDDILPHVDSTKALARHCIRYISERTT
ncbi:aspartate racemase [Gluconacetobacter johannae DSM 13595]|nr:aspartate racemase [Gluconacetobacter johannae DSM 13595]